MKSHIGLIRQSSIKVCGVVYIDKPEIKKTCSFKYDIFSLFGGFLKSEFFIFIFVLETLQLFPGIASGLVLGISFCASVFLSVSA